MVFWKKDKGAGGAKRSKKKIIMIVLAFALLLGGANAGVYYWFLAPPPKPKALQPGKVVALDAITVNLNDGHYLKVRIALQTTKDVKEAPDGSKALDITIAQFSNRSVGELSSNPAREQMKSQLRKKITEAYPGEVMDVFLTEFVMQ